MNLLIVSVDFLPQIGGISLMTHHLGNALVDLGHQVRILAPAGARQLDDYPARYDLIEDRRSQVKVRETAAYVGEIERVCRLLDELHHASPLDAVLLLHVFYYGWPVRRFCRAAGLPYGVFVHGFEFRSQLMKPRAWTERLGIAWREHEDLRQSTLRVVRDASARFVNSTATGNLLRDAAVGDAAVVGVGVADEVVAEQGLAPLASRDTEFRARILEGRDHGICLLGILGRVVASKNIPFLVDVLVHLPASNHLAVAGSGDLDALREHARQCGVSDRVHLLGALSEAEKWRFLAALDLFCLPSVLLPGGQMEGFGIVMVEATIRGTPVAVSRCGGMRDFVLDHNGLYLDVEDAAASAAAIAAFLADERRVRQAVGNAQHLVAEQLTWERIAARLATTLSAAS